MFSPLEQFETFNIIFTNDFFIFLFGGLISFFIKYWVFMYFKNLFIITGLVSFFIFFLFCIFYSLIDIKIFKFT